MYVYYTVYMYTHRHTHPISLSPYLAASLYKYVPEFCVLWTWVEIMEDDLNRDMKGLLSRQRFLHTVSPSRLSFIPLYNIVKILVVALDLV